MDIKSLIQRNRLRKQINDAAYDEYLKEVVTEQAIQE